MLLQRFGFTSPISHLPYGLDRLIDGTIVPERSLLGLADGTPALDVWEDQEHIFVRADVPGMTFGDLEVTVQGDELTIKGEHSSGGEELEYLVQERVQRKFARTVQLSPVVDTERVTASLKDGVLTVTLPKAQETLPRRIDVNG